MSAAAIKNYQSYRNLPPLAGVADFAAASRPGLSVEACVARLKRYHYAFRRLHEILTARITAEPIYELKTAFSHNAYLCAEHVQALRTRVGEMREPPLGLEEVPDPPLEVFFDEILAAPTTAELLVGVYEKALPALDAAFARHQADTNPLTDAPSLRVCRFARLEIGDMIAFGTRSIECLVDSAARKGMEGWLKLLDTCLAAAGSLNGTAMPSGETVTRRHSAKPYVYDPVPRRDERFTDPWNQGVNAEAFLYDPALPALDAVLARHLADTNPLTDAPSVRVCRFARLELADMLAFGRQSIACLVDDAARSAMRPWLDLLDRCLAAAGGLDGATDPSGETVARMHSARPYVYDPSQLNPRTRKPKIYSQGANPGTSAPISNW